MQKRRLTTAQWQSILYAVPVVLVSTRSPAGVDNVSPYGMCMPISHNPSLYAIGVHPNRDTYDYIREHKEFAINLLTPELKEACLKTAEALPREKSEFDHAGLTRVAAAETDLALVGESPACFECRLEWMKQAGDHDLVVGRVVAAWVQEEYYHEDADTMRLNYDGLYHIGGKYFGRGPELGG